MCDSIKAQEEAYDACGWWKELGSYLVALILLVLPLRLSLVWIRTAEPGLRLLWSPWLRWSDSPSFFSLPERVFPMFTQGQTFARPAERPQPLQSTWRKGGRKEMSLFPLQGEGAKTPEVAEHAELNLNLLSPSPLLKYPPSLSLCKSSGCYSQL